MRLALRRTGHRAESAVARRLGYDLVDPPPDETVWRIALADSELETRRRAILAWPESPTGSDVLAGPADAILGRLLGLPAVVDERLVLDVGFGRLPDDQATDSLERFSREVAPRLRPQPLLPPRLPGDVM